VGVFLTPNFIKSNQVKKAKHHDLFTSLIGEISSTAAKISSMDRDQDSSHGLFISAGLMPKEPKDGQPDEKPAIQMQAKIWGSQSDLANALFTAAKKDPDLTQLLSNVGLMIATDKLQQARRRELKKASESIIQPKKGIIKPGDKGFIA
jgi:hypothetical protein